MKCKESTVNQQLKLYVVIKLQNNKDRAPSKTQENKGVLVYYSGAFYGNYNIKYHDLFFIPTDNSTRTRVSTYCTKNCEIQRYALLFESGLFVK